MDFTSNLPDEILFEVLAQSTLYHSLFNHELLYSTSIWFRILRHKKSLALVCKRWNSLSSPFLYGHVVIRRVPQLESFMHTLSKSTLGLMVEELTLAEGSCTDFGSEYYRDMVLRPCEPQKNIIRKLPHLCQRLKRLNIRTQITAEVVDEILSHPNLSRITDIHVEIDDRYKEDLRFSRLKSFFPKISGRIQRLSFNGYDRRAETHPDGALGDMALEFPALEELRIACPIFSLPNNWSLPRLTRLIIRTPIWTKKTLISFLRRHGGTLEQLSLFDSALPVAASLSLCPKIEYLTVNSLPAMRQCQKSFPSVKIIDVYPNKPGWNVPWTWARESVAFKEFIGYFPSLQAVRILCDWDIEHLYFLPLSLPFGVDPIHVFREGCTWEGVPPTRFQAFSIPNGSETGTIFVQCASLQIIGDFANDDSTYTPSDEEGTTIYEETDSDGSEAM